MAYTLLEIVQSVLSSMDGDEVDAYDDTQESRQVANMAKDVYYDIIYRLDPPQHETIFELEASGDNTKPTLMFLPTKARKLNWIKYDNQESGDSETSFEIVNPLDFDTFHQRMSLLSTASTNVETFSHLINDNADTVNFFCYNDRFPTTWTSFDDYTIVFDAYDNTEETTLTKARTLCSGILYPTWTASDSFTPDLEESLFPLFLEELRMAAFANLRQMENQDAGRRARRQWVKSQQSKDRVRPHSWFDRLPDYGRKRP